MKRSMVVTIDISPVYYGTNVNHLCSRFSIVSIFVVCGFYHLSAKPKTSNLFLIFIINLKMADDAASSSACTGNLIDNSINQDELIMKQQREIEKEVRTWYIAVSARYRWFCFFLLRFDVCVFVCF